MESSPSAAALSSSLQLSSVIETSPIPPHSAAPSSSAQLSLVIETSLVPPLATLVTFDESPSDTLLSSYEPSVVAKPVMYIEGRYSSSSRPTKFEVFPDANNVGSCDYFYLPNLSFIYQKKTWSKKEVLGNFNFKNL